MIHPERDDWARQLTALRQQMAEQAASLDASGEFPWRNIDHLRAGGWLSLAVPPSCGGAGASLAQLQQVIAAIAWGEPATALIVCMQYLHHLRLAENDAWHAPLRQQVFHDAVEHGGLINSLRVEPELGSPARGGLPDTVATRRAEGWDISGHKIYTTGIEGLRWLAVWARSDDNPPLVGTWLVPGDSPGISVVKSWDHAGMRATGSHEVIFNHVRVAAEHAVDVWPTDAPPAAQAEPFRLFANRQTALLAAIYDSIAHAAHDWLVRWLAGRVPAGLGHPLSRLPRVQEKVGQIAGLLLVNRSLLEQAAALRFSAIEANLAKVTITDNAIQAVNIALELTGNHGLSRQNPLERHYRNVLCGRVHTPQSDSAYLDHDQRYARTDAFLDIVRQVWTSEQPVDIHNDFYQAEQAWSAIRPLQKPHLPIYFGGSSEAAIAVAGKHADVFALWGESLAQTGETIQRVRAEAAKHQRDIGFSVSFRPIIADSEAEAWEKAEHILHVATEQAAQRGGGFKAKPESIGAQRLRATAALGRVVDKRLWTGIAQLVGGGHNSTALVGTPEQVADALLDYYDLGVRNFLIRGFDPLNDAADYGRALLPIAREKAARRAVAERAS
ncbi:butyryl-CoA dehydrogenase [Klebsiella pneumoniae]|nr:butyryl-CoA dehydrogenase [Klebsiella pneumoniae]